MEEESKDEEILENTNFSLFFNQEQPNKNSWIFSQSKADWI